MISIFKIEHTIVMDKFTKRGRKFPQDKDGWLREVSIQKRKTNLDVFSETKVRYITPKNNGEISSSITQNWTDQAVLCYTSGCNCIDCSIAQGNYSFVCQMPNVIKILLEQVGPPDQDKVDRLLA